MLCVQVVCPALTLATVVVLVRAGWLPATDRVLLLFILLQGATPSAMFLGIIAQIHSSVLQQRAMTACLFAVNVAAIPLFTASVALFLGLCDPVNTSVFYNAQPQEMDCFLCPFLLPPSIDS